MITLAALKNGIEICHKEYKVKSVTYALDLFEKYLDKKQITNWTEVRRID